jgi:hypothetical protein
MCRPKSFIVVSPIIRSMTHFGIVLHVM